MDDINDNFVSHDKFLKFTDVLLELSNGKMEANNCRNCLTKCTTENKKCLPHNFYFDKVEFSDEIIKLKKLG